MFSHPSMRAWREEELGIQREHGAGESETEAARIESLGLEEERLKMGQYRIVIIRRIGEAERYIHTHPSHMHTRLIVPGTMVSGIP